jgi:2-phosphoglycolate phosphatase
MIRTVLFDLDGTLLDTAPDLAYALNRVLEEQYRDPLPLGTIRPVVSHGTTGLLRLGFGIDPQHPRFAPLRERLLAIYQDHLACETRLFPGMAEVLDTLEQQDRQWGVVTNKPGWLTEPLLEQLGLRARSACVVSGDTTARRKPDPQPMLYACRVTGSGIRECVYVGDAERDITAGRSAGMSTLVAAYGYIGADECPEHWGADAIIQCPGEIIDWIGQCAPSDATPGKC